AQGSSRGLEQGGNVDIEGAEAHAELSQGAASVLIERLDLRLDALALENPERLRQLEGEIAHAFGNGLGLGEVDERAERLAHMRDEPERDARLDRLPALFRQRLV